MPKQTNINLATTKLCAEWKAAAATAEKRHRRERRIVKQIDGWIDREKHVYKSINEIDN